MAASARGIRWALLVALAVAGGCRQPVAPTPTRTLQPVVIHEHHTGDDLPAAESIMLINSQAQLDALGHKRLSELKLDFSRQSLLIVTLGTQTTTGWWVRIDSAQQDGADLYFQGVANAPGEAQTVAPRVTHPFAAAVISKVQNVRLHPEIESVQGKAPHAR